MKKILITGGAGYIGTTLVPVLLNLGYDVTIYDNLIYNGDILIPYFSNPKFSFIKGDILETEKLKKAVSHSDVIIHLAAIVGYEACNRNTELAEMINTTATKQLVDMVSSNQLLLFGSTGSNYGIVDGICTEETPLNPLSVYAKTKTNAETIIMQHPNAIAYRFATAFGASPRLRLDLLINELTYLAISQKYILVYQPEFMRTFIHVQDIANCFVFAIKNKDLMRSNVYNVGSNDMNFTKRDICEMIKQKTNCVVYYNDFDSDKDHRDYQVSYDKLNALGYKTTISIDDGIDELIKVYQVLNLKNKKYINAGI
jgi:nucleoside-diphosphate-sugar epimerase